MARLSNSQIVGLLLSWDNDKQTEWLELDDDDNEQEEEE